MKWQSFTRPEGNVTSIIVLGAGGIGARVIPALIKMVMPGTGIYVVDPDTVEERNLVRQNFSSYDIGRPKAEVMADRYHTERVHVIPYVDRFENCFAHVVGDGRGRGGSLMLIGGVDNRATRKKALQFSNDYQCFYIDAGNEGNAGQVLLAGFTPAILEGEIEYNGPHWVSIEGKRSFPDVFDETQDEADKGPSCGYRIDTQTVLANMMAAQVALNYAGMWLYRMPITTVGASFSTLNNITPIPAEAGHMGTQVGYVLRPVGTETPQEEAARKRAAENERKQRERRARLMREEVRYAGVEVPEDTEALTVDSNSYVTRQAVRYLTEIHPSLRTVGENAYIDAFNRDVERRATEVPTEVQG